MADVIAVDLGGTNIRAARVNISGKILAHDKVPTRATEGMDAVVGRIAGLVRTLSRKSTVAVGIGTPGSPDPLSGRMNLPAVNIPGSADYPLGEKLAKLTGLPVFCENDASLAALGESWLGAGRNEAVVLIFTLGTGIGGGCVIHGEVYHGNRNLGTEFGHVSIELEGRPCKCGGTGCVEQYASASALGRDARVALQSPALAAKKSLLWKLCGGPAGIESVDARMVCEAARAGDELALCLLDRCCLCLASAVGAMLNAFNPSCVILAGGMALAGELITSRVEKHLNCGRAFGAIWSDCKLKVAELGDDAGLLGAARLALKKGKDG